MKLVIEAGRPAKQYWRELWRYRELFLILAWRDLAVRYKQTVVGVSWAILRPALTMLVFVAFRRIMGAAPSPVPEPILVLAAVLPWQFFAAALTESSGSLVGNANLISKIYFPRIIIPCAAAVASLADFVVTLAMLAALMLWYGFAPGWQVLAIPLLIVLSFGLATSLGLLLATLNVEYRDFRYIVPFIVQFGMFVSPIAFTSSDIPERWRLVYSLNPMVGVIDGFRWALLPGQPLEAKSLAASAAVTAALLLLGTWYFRRMERRFADVI